MSISKESIVKNGKLLRESGFLVDVHFRKSGNSITISPMLLGLDVRENDDLKTFFDDFMDNNRVNFLKKDAVRKVDSISKSAHKQKRAMALGATGSYMTKEVLEDYKKYLEGKKVEYFNERDRIVANYDDYIAEFESDFRGKLISSTLKKLDFAEREDIINKVLSRIPTKEEYSQSFKVELSRTKITMIDDVEEEDQEDVLEDTLSTVHEIVGKTLSVAFSNLNNLLEAKRVKGSLNARNKSIFVSVTNDLRKRNIFNNSIIQDVQDAFTSFIDRNADDYEIEEESELLLSKIYCYAKSLNVNYMLDLTNCALSEEEMEETMDVVDLVAVM